MLMLLAAAGWAQQRSVDRVLPALTAGGGCASSVELQNLGERPVTVTVEAYDENGALVSLKNHPALAVDLVPRVRESYRLELPGKETRRAWMRVREPPASAPFTPVVAVRGLTECVAGNELRTVARGVVFPMRNPWFEGNVSELPGDLLAVVNASLEPAVATLCYSASSFYFVPDGRQGGELTPVCSESLVVQIPPLSSRQFPVARNGSTRFSLHSAGRAVALEMLKPKGARVQVYAVDSSIHFGGEVVDK